MPILTIIGILLIVGLLLWALTMIPLDPKIHRIIRVIVIVIVCLWLISIFFGVNLGSLGTVGPGPHKR